VIGNWIRDQRKARGWTQAQLAEYSGVKLSYLKQLEIGERNPGTKILAGLANAFQVPVEVVLREAGMSVPAPLAELENEIPKYLFDDLQRRWPELAEEDREAILAQYRAIIRRYPKRNPGQHEGSMA
jgi:transcriptional regulator with XRE-family HTH domain